MSIDSRPWELEAAKVQLQIKKLEVDLAQLEVDRLTAIDKVVQGRDNPDWHSVDGSENLPNVYGFGKVMVSLHGSHVCSLPLT